MPAFPKPETQFSFNVQDEIANLRNFRDTAENREIPDKTDDHILIATWNIANFGLQQRRDEDYQLIAEIISWFDLVGIQELYDNLEGLRKVQDFLPDSYKVVFNDKAGNEERAGFVYDENKITTLEMVGEVAVAPSQVKHIKLPGISRKYEGFDRNPYFVSFRAGEFDFVIANVHLFFGDDTDADQQRRALEAYAVSRWADLRRDDAHRYSDNFLVLGDFNLPKYEPGDLIYEALRKRGLQRPEHSTKVGSNLSGDSHYDQILFFTGDTKDRYTGKTGIFDFDTTVFPDLWDQLNENLVWFRSYLRYYFTDHRPLWAQFRTTF